MSFCNRPTIHMNIEDNDFILNKLGKMVNFRQPKIHTFSRYNINDLKNFHYLLTFKTNGSPCYLFLTIINGKKYSLFIDYKNPYKIQIYNVKLRFNDELYNDTIIDGELLINDKNNWIFMLNNILYYKNEYIGNKLLGYRISILSDIIRNQYKFDDFLNPCHLQLRSYFLFNHLELLSTTQNNKLLLIPEYSNKPTLSFNIANLHKNEKIIKNLSLNTDNINVKKFYVIQTETPDVFELYREEFEDDNTKQNFFNGIACLSKMSHSFYIKKLFDEIQSHQKGIWIKFIYNNDLNGWEPLI